MKATATRAYRTLYRLRNELDFKKWVMRIFINKCKIILRSRRNLIDLSAGYKPKALELSVEPGIMELVNALDESLHEVVLLHYFGELSVKEIAGVLRVAEGAVESRLYRAKELIGGNKLDLLVDTTDPMPSVIREKLDAHYEALPEHGTSWLIRYKANWVGYVALILLVGTFLLAYFSPSIRSVFVKAAVAHVDHLAEDHGISIKLDQVSYDGSKLLIELSHDENVLIQLDSFNETIQIDGKPIYGFFGGTSRSGMSTTNYLIDVKESLPESFKLELNIQHVNTIENANTKTIDGNWRFEADVVQLKDGVINKIFDPPLIREFGGIRIAITGVEVSPFITEVDFDLVRPDKYNDFLSAQEVPKGEEVERLELRFELWNEHGSQIESRGSSGSGMSNNQERYNVRYAPITTETKTFTLRAVEVMAKMRSKGNGSYDVIQSTKTTIDELEIVIPLEVGRMLE
jgi:hypothetical protein